MSPVCMVENTSISLSTISIKVLKYEENFRNQAEGKRNLFFQLDLIPVNSIFCLYKEASFPLVKQNDEDPSGVNQLWESILQPCQCSSAFRSSGLYLVNVLQSLRARRLTLNDCFKALLRIPGTQVGRGNVTHLQLELEYRVAEAYRASPFTLARSSSR